MQPEIDRHGSGPVTSSMRIYTNIENDMVTRIQREKGYDAEMRIYS